MACMDAIVHGRVQGVFFRFFVQGRASALGLTGYARNLPDGNSVEVVAEGTRARLEELLKSLRNGPPEARVDQVELVWSGYTGGFSGFEIMR
ncbi:MAG: acylphosphatase [Dehalococcoidia bacterium]|nr:acylphosphatase [Dehalococcoidia bacterium]